MITISIVFIALLQFYPESSEATDNDCSAYPYAFCGTDFQNYEDGECHYTYNWFYCEDSDNGCSGSTCSNHEEEEEV
ncbi:MAG: hypothetical protein LAT51_13060 [Flavobacteriaceae bacterium]|nr:hypothetical protein [Flavobacteriaceae bacterium]